eukprot:5012568-Pleurochrysis_carterae.AAC.1
MVGVLSGRGAPISGVWHRRTFHPGSNRNPVTGVIGRIGAAVPSWRSRAAWKRSPSVASVWPNSDPDSASSRSSSPCPSGG